jgi:hypothetical protein
MASSFIITVDKLDPPGSEQSMVGVTVSRGLQPELERRVTAGEGVAFRLLDGDGEVYYQGRHLQTTDTERDVFAPLDWGSGYAGCTSLQHREGGSWVDV